VSRCRIPISLRSVAPAGRATAVSIPGGRVRVVETLIGGARRQPEFAERGIRHSRRVARNGCAPSR
jgi:hypothetical protein